MSSSAVISQARHAWFFNQYDRVLALLAPLRNDTVGDERHEAFSISGQAEAKLGNLEQAITFLTISAEERRRYTDWLHLGKLAIQTGDDALAGRALQQARQTVDTDVYHPLALDFEFAEAWVSAENFPQAQPLLTPLRDHYLTLPRLDIDYTQRMNLPAFHHFFEVAWAALEGLNSAEKIAWLTPLLSLSNADARGFAASKIRQL